MCACKRRRGAEQQRGAGTARRSGVRGSLGKRAKPPVRASGQVEVSPDLRCGGVYNNIPKDGRATRPFHSCLVYLPAHMRAAYTVHRAHICATSHVDHRGRTGRSGLRATWTVTTGQRGSGTRSPLARARGRPKRKGPCMARSYCPPQLADLGRPLGLREAMSPPAPPHTSQGATHARTTWPQRRLWRTGRPRPARPGPNQALPDPDLTPRHGRYLPLLDAG